MKSADLIVHAGVVVTVDQEDRVLCDHSLVIQDGLITDLLPTESALVWDAEIEVDCRKQILMPGLINTHCHLAMNLLRGFADDLPLQEWLQNHIWPAEAKWVNPEFVRLGTELALAESLLSGVTCVNDMYFFPDVAASAAEKSGIRATLGLIVLDFPSAWASGVDDYISKGLALHDQLKHNPLLNTAFAPHAPYTVSREPLQRIASYAAELEIPVHMHIHETAKEVDEFQTQFGCRPLQVLHELNLLSPALMAVHMTQLNSAEIQLIADTGTHVLHCPQSNLKLASGACPTGELLAQGVNVSLGTDGAASNNDLDMFDEMRTAALLAKHISQDASTLPAAAALRMATHSGATALGLADKTGSLEIGKAADCIAVNYDEIWMSPMYDPVSHLVYASDRSNVNHVWVAGRQLVKDRQLLTLDKSFLITQAQLWAEQIQASPT